MHICSTCLILLSFFKHVLCQVGGSTWGSNVFPGPGQQWQQGTLPQGVMPQSLRESALQSRIQELEQQLALAQSQEIGRNPIANRVVNDGRGLAARFGGGFVPEQLVPPSDIQSFPFEPPGSSGGIQFESPPGPSRGMQFESPPGPSGGVQFELPPGPSGGVQFELPPGPSGGVQFELPPGPSGGVQFELPPGPFGGVQFESPPGSGRVGSQFNGAFPRGDIRGASPGNVRVREVMPDISRAGRSFGPVIDPRTITELGPVAPKDIVSIEPSFEGPDNMLPPKEFLTATVKDRKPGREAVNRNDMRKMKKEKHLRKQMKKQRNRKIKEIKKSTHITHIKHHPQPTFKGYISKSHSPPRPPSIKKRRRNILKLGMGLLMGSALLLGK